jgi:tetratricopeptide (TPR) repeat protein
MKYWRDIGDRYDMADSYNTSFDRIKRMRIPEKWLFNYYVEVARFLQLNEYYDGAEKLFNKVLDMKRSEEIGINGSNLLNIAGSISDLAELLRMKGEYDRAENLFREALHIIKDDPTYANLETAIILNNLALLLQNKGKLYEAEDL